VFGIMLTQVMMALVLVVFAINVILYKPTIDSLLFAVALAAGVAPELLLAVISITLSKGGQSGNIFAPQELDLLRKEKAVGDTLLRFFNQNGKLVETGLEKQVISMSLQQLSKVSRAVGVAGGSRKYAAVLGALRGHWINILVTDHFTAKRLANE